MKKIHLSIPQPCHEDWDAMTPVEKGKFCSSCQKAVIDFTNMSDRQIAEFFKKPPSSVCGRIYNDQLNRGIVIPKKRIPWIKYFFQFTWPAFALFLKSCGVKDNSQGKIKIQAKTSHRETESIATVGIMMPYITPVIDTISIIKEEVSAKREIVGGVAIILKDDTIKAMTDTLDEIQMEKKPMDTVTVIAYPATMGKVVMGGVTSVCIVENNQTQRDSIKNEPLPEKTNFKVYPNPVKTSSSLTIEFESENDFPGQIQLFSSSGQLILSEQNKTEHVSSMNIPIPSNITAGIYFLQMVTKSKQVKTTRIIVTK